MVEADGKNPISLGFPFILCVGVQQSPGMAAVCGGHSMSIFAVKTTKWDCPDPLAAEVIALPNDQMDAGRWTGVCDNHTARQ